MFGPPCFARTATSLSRAGEDGLSVEEKIGFEKKRAEQLESAIRDDQIVASFGRRVTKDLEKKVRSWLRHFQIWVQLRK